MIPEEIQATQTASTGQPQQDGAGNGHVAAAAELAAQRLVSYNPATGEPVGDVAMDDEADVRTAIARARAAQPAWAARSLDERSRVLRAFRRVLLARANWLTDLIAREQGRPEVEALTQEILPIADLVTYYTKRAKRFLRDEKLPMHLLMYKRSFVQYKPYGVVAVISPWNYPFALPASEVVLALLAGNAVVLKPSEFTPLIGQAIGELFQQAGLPDGLLQIVQGDGRTGGALVAATPDKISFIGGGSTARRIMAAAADNLTPVALELGGNDAAIVLHDADLDRAANAVVWGSFCNAGQVCASVERVYVDKRIAEPFTSKVVELTRQIRVGQASGPDAPVEMGPMISERQIQIVQRHVDSALASGAKALTGGKRNAEGQLFYEPTVLVDVRDDLPVMREETFGPVLPIATFDSEDEAIRRANDSDFGLSAYVFSKNRRHAERVARQLEAGSVLINDVIMSYGAPETPWGGVKQSGIGRIHGGAQGLREYCQQRHIMTERFQPLRHELWWFPYRPGGYRRFLGLMRAMWGR
ncbi:MAG: aldehyde dehydrogenase family protein [Ktedonobacterales bacterium]